MRSHGATVAMGGSVSNHLCRRVKSFAIFDLRFAIGPEPWRSNTERFRADQHGGEFLQTGVGIGPGSGREAHFFGAEAVEKLFLAPAGFPRHLWQEASGAVVEREVNSVGLEIKIRR